MPYFHLYHTPSDFDDILLRSDSEVLIGLEFITEKHTNTFEQNDSPVKIALLRLEGVVKVLA
ncbi:MAG: hypothetical protein II956_14990 [Bacteroidales bacterium]|nr:hypothetical protein [Bacteroidales bacterium]